MTAAASGERWTEWEDEDALFRQLRLTVRQSLADGESAKEAWDALTDVGVWDFAVPLERGGLELGQSVMSMVCEEAGNSMQPIPLLGTLVALDLLAASDDRAELLDQVRSGELPVPIPGRLPGLEGCLAPSLAWRSEVGGTERAGGLGGRLHGTAGPFSIGVEPGALLLLFETPDGPCVSLLTLPSAGVELRELAERGGGPVATAVLTDAALPAGSVLMRGEAARRALARVGLRVAVYQAALLTGFAAAAVTATVERIRSRQQFGQSLVKHQAPRLRVAGLLARLDALRWAVADAARGLDRGVLPPGEAAGLLALAAETALDVTRDAVHLHGASGLARDSIAAACYRRVAWEALRCGRPAVLWETAAGHP